MEALAKRSTARAFDAKELSPQQLSSLLWAAFGINRPDGKRTAPSAMNYQETDIYVLFKQGAYVIREVQQTRSGCRRRHPGAGWNQAFVTNAPVTLIYVADMAKMAKVVTIIKRTQPILMSVYISQNVYLFCASEGLVTGARGSVDRVTLGPRLKLRPEQMIILAQSVGHPKP